MDPAALGGALAGSFADIATAKHMMRYQNRLQSANYRKRYQVQKADLLKAGYNPILAVSQAPPTMSPVSSTRGHFSSGAASAKDIRTTEQMDTLRKKLEQDIDESISRVKVQTEQGKKIIQEVKESVQRVKNLAQEYWGISSKRELNQAQTKKILADVQHLRATLVKASQMSEVYRGQEGAILARLEAYLKASGLAQVIPMGKRSAVKQTNKNSGKIKPY